MKKLQAQQSQLQDFPGLAFEELELAQWQPIIDMTAAPVPSDPAAVTSVQNEQTVDQYQSDLPVPPPWIKDRQS